MKTLALLVLIALVIGVWWLLRQKSTDEHPLTDEAPAAPELDAPPHAPDTPSTLTHELPEALLAFEWRNPSQIPHNLHEVLLSHLRDIPAPVAALKPLISADTTLGAPDLNTLLSTQAPLAGKVLATVNSPFYGLSEPVADIPQSIVRLGADAVRCLSGQYLLAQAFKARTPELRQALDGLWGASAIACELTLQLAPKLGLPEPGPLATRVLLSFVGRMATLSVLPPEQALPLMRMDLLQRSTAEQGQLGLSASAMGGLLMHEWNLPDELIADVIHIDHVMTTSANPQQQALSPQLALAYFCTRMGEKLAFGQLAQVSDYHPELDDSIDMLCWKTYLALPTLARLPELLAQPETTAGVTRMVSTIRGA